MKQEKKGQTCNLHQQPTLYGIGMTPAGDTIVLTANQTVSPADVPATTTRTHAPGEELQTPL